MAYKIVETEMALQDLNSILAYIALTLANPSAAASLADEIESCYVDLEKMLLMFARCHDPRLRAQGYRKAAIKDYVMVYKVDEPTKTVLVMRFFYGRQGHEKLI